MLLLERDIIWRLLWKLSNFNCYTNQEIESLSFVSRIALIWITGAAAFKNILCNGYDIKSLKFEDFLCDPEKNLKALFDFCNISHNLMPDVLKVLSKDSQAGSKWSSRKMKASSIIFADYTEALKNEIDVLCNDFDLPKFWTSISLENKLVE